MIKTKIIRKGEIFVLLGLIIFTFLLANEPQKADWKGKVLQEEGVRVVVNPPEPIYGKIELAFQEDLRIGSESNSQSQFYRVRDVAVDSQGNIYVGDMSNCRVQKFDPTGKYLQTIGRSGQGPGEFERPTLIRFAPQTGDILVKDQIRRINIFNNQGTFIRALNIEGGFIDFCPVSSGDLFAILYSGSDEELTSSHTLGLLDHDGNLQSRLLQFPTNIYMKRMGQGIMVVGTGYELSMYLAQLDESTLVFGFSKEYQLIMIGSDGRTLLRIRKEEPPPKFTAKEKKDFGKIPVPSVKPYFFGLLTDSEGRIFVQRNMNEQGKRGFGPIAVEDKAVDVFSNDGHFLCQTTLPPSARVIRGDRVYSYFVDEDKGMEYVQRFRVKNWDALPKGITSQAR